ncbi:class I SAM-dependent methyltransferase [Candidatus Gracilibacteria bacterium]|nr:class I SAM-dependent methyltransferase [Candidatus Gracilibacteria bacterium]
MSLLFSFIIIIIILLFLRGALSLAPWVPTRKEAIFRLGDLLDIKPGESFLELGSGDGRVVSFLAKKNPESQFIGIEIVPYLYVVSLLRKYFGKQSNLEFKIGNAFKEDFGRYTHIFVFGLPESIRDTVLPKLEKEAKIGTKLYSYAFSFPKEYMHKVESFGTPNEQKIHIYTKK